MNYIFQVCGVQLALNELRVQQDFNSMYLNVRTHLRPGIEAFLPGWTDLIFSVTDNVIPFLFNLKNGFAELMDQFK